MHVSEYVWAAAHSFHRPGTPAAEAWVAGHLTTILHGRASRAAAEITAQAERAGLRGAKREAADTCVGYLAGHLDQLCYDTALAEVWPIATGPIEGVQASHRRPSGDQAARQGKALVISAMSPAVARVLDLTRTRILLAPQPTPPRSDERAPSRCTDRRR